MGSDELRQEYESMTGRKVKPASPSTSIGGPIWSIADWLLARRDGVSLFATGLGLVIAAGFLVAMLTIVAILKGPEQANAVTAILAIAVQFLAWITGLIGLFTMLAGTIRIGTNADARPNDRHTDRTSQR